MNKHIYILSKLGTRQKIIFALVAIASIALSFTLFGLIITILFYLLVFSASLSAFLFIYGKIYNFINKEKTQRKHTSKSSKNTIINAEAISVEVTDKREQ